MLGREEGRKGGREVGWERQQFMEFVENHGRKKAKNMEAVMRNERDRSPNVES